MMIVNIYIYINIWWFIHFKLISSWNQISNVYIYVYRFRANNVYDFWSIFNNVKKYIYFK